MDNVVCCKTTEKLRKRIDVNLVSKEIDYSKWTSKPSYMWHLVAIHKSKVTLTLNKPAYISMFILDSSKILMYELFYDYIKNE